MKNQSVYYFADGDIHATEGIHNFIIFKFAYNILR